MILVGVVGSGMGTIEAPRATEDNHPTDCVKAAMRATANRPDVIESGRAQENGPSAGKAEAVEVRRLVNSCAIWQGRHAHTIRQIGNGSGKILRL